MFGEGDSAGGGVMLRDLHCFFPGDLNSFTRKPLFVLVDSDNSSVFGNLAPIVFGNLAPMFGQPLVLLMSPQDSPHHFHEEHQRGNLFTLFLHCPLMGLCLVSSVCDVPMLLWEKCQALVDRFIAEASRLVSRSRNNDPAYIQFFSDDFLRLLTLRFTFCATVLRAHRAFKGGSQYPRCSPSLPEGEVLGHPALHSLVLEIATGLEVAHLFNDAHVDNSNTSAPQRHD
ncbi:protein SCAI-like [Hyalella azteca]|uniref:Protein SCAI-like n=1 Tax=Hyalella azteca TaxID=294128 RepID=A0A979FPC3_HYAAZ|nr:protein SCAI-like [Hyalella azteca]